MAEYARPMRGWPSRAVVLVTLATTACSSTLQSDLTARSTGPTTSFPALSTAPSTVPTTTTSTVAPTTTLPADPLARLEQCVHAWPIRDRAALLVWPGVSGAAWGDAIALVRDQHVGGVVLMGMDASFAAQLPARLAELDAQAPHGLLVATDEEGGEVQRLRALQPLPSQEAMSQMTADDARALLADHARVVAAAGVDVVLGPVADVRAADGSDPLGQGRLFLGGPDAVTAWTALYVTAWQAAGLTPVLKHFPGHGSASGDTHDGHVTTPAIDVLLTRDLVPYAALAGSGAAVMIGHLDVPGLTGGQPASRSPQAVALLRDQLGWGDALVLSDALGMGAVGMPVPQAAVASIAAGVDAVVFTANGATPAVIDALVAAVAAGTIPEARLDEAAARVAATLEAHGRACA